MDIKIRNKFIEIKNCISDWFVIFVTNNRKNVEEMSKTYKSTCPQ